MTDVDVRHSFCKNLTYGNRTVIPTMFSWRGMVNGVYVNGEHSQVFATMMGVADASRNYGEFGYPIEAVVGASTPGPKFWDWVSFLNNWYGIGVVDTTSQISEGDILLLIDIDDHSDTKMVDQSTRLVRRASQVKARVYAIVQPGAKLPKALSGLNGVGGSNNKFLNQFAYPIIENVAYNNRPGKIYIFGSSPRVVTSAIGALDFFARFNTSTPMAELSRRVCVDLQIPQQNWGPGVSSLEAALKFFGFPIAVNAPANIVTVTSKVMVTPV